MNLYRNINLVKPAIALLSLLITGPVSCDSSVPTVCICTEMGDITVEIYTSRAPVTATNFLSHVDRGDYTNSSFYRVVRMDNQPQNRVRIEVIQGGLFLDELIDTIPPIIHETTRQSGLRHTDGVISMARNEPGSASTEFFICIGDQPSLDFGGDRNPDGQGFAAFGRVTGGMDVVRAIQALPDDDQYLKQQVIIRNISRIIVN
jgi:peptidyl-prolyl cis-trans isomerase A (cyclophilin A)